MARVPVQCMVEMAPRQAIKHFSKNPDDSTPVKYVSGSLKNAMESLKRGNLLQVAGALRSDSDTLTKLKALLEFMEDPDSVESQHFMQELDDMDSSTRTVSSWAKVAQEGHAKREEWGKPKDDDLAPPLPPTPEKRKVQKLNTHEREASVAFYVKMADEDPERFMKIFRQSPEIFNSQNPKRIQICRHGQTCRFGSSCGFAHSKKEMEVMRTHWKHIFHARGWVWRDPDAVREYRAQRAQFDDDDDEEY